MNLYHLEIILVEIKHRTVVTNQKDIPYAKWTYKVQTGPNFKQSKHSWGFNTYIKQKTDEIIKVSSSGYATHST